MSSNSSSQERDDEEAADCGCAAEVITTTTTRSGGEQKQQLPDADEEESGAEAVPSCEAAAATDRVENNNDSKPTNNTNKLEAFEIEMGRQVSSEISDQELDTIVAELHGTIGAVPSHDDDEPHNDMESLLGNGSRQADGTRRKQQQDSDGKGSTVRLLVQCLPCCCESDDNGDTTATTQFGNIRVICPKIYAKTRGWGVVGPHWFGPPCVIAILVFATIYFGYQCSFVNLHRPLTAATCLIFGIMTLYHLVNTAYRDPGIIVQGKLALPDPVPRNYRWCELCNYYQPPSAAHCPDCNVCVAGFDHHCVWMGTCIGVGNFKPFVRFNLSWLAYLIYAIVWVTVVAPIIEHHQHA